jgi:16S rRNA U516 pseudouridylate synthase RsuA-like enzyme
MVEAEGNKVVALKRIRIKKIMLGVLPLGKHCFLTTAEIEALLS